VKPSRHFARTRVIAEESISVSPFSAKPAVFRRPSTRREPEPELTTQLFVFDPDEIEGGFAGPEGEAIVVAPPIVHSSLIDIRRHFVPEMLKTLEDL
jgi:hypothetical protein